MVRQPDHRSSRLRRNTQVSGHTGKNARHQATGSGQVRIIGGQWRGRKLRVANVPGLRPSGDRLRETLFNWLQMAVPGGRCLDLFAGSGVLGLEAASRGAAAVTLVEPNTLAAATLSQQLVELGADDRVQLVQSTAQAFLASSEQAFDVVFVDPPFSESLHSEALAALGRKHLNDDALVYVEAPKSLDMRALAATNFSIHRQQAFGEINAFLLHRCAETDG
jgi:16S rRNA (guanine966-N2)-methyltransferase